MYYEDENYYEPSVMNELLDEFQQKCREILLDDTNSKISEIKHENEYLKQENELLKAALSKAERNLRDTNKNIEEFSLMEILVNRIKNTIENADDKKDRIYTFLNCIFKKDYEEDVTDTPLWIGALTQFYSNKETVLKILRMFHVDLPKNVENFRLPIDWDEKELDMFFDTIYNHVNCNGCTFDRNLRFWGRGSLSDAETQCYQSNYSEIPWQYVLRNPLLKKEKYLEQIGKNAYASCNWKNFYKIQCYLDLTEKEIKIILNNIDYTKLKNNDEVAAFVLNNLKYIENDDFMKKIYSLFHNSYAFEYQMKIIEMPYKYILQWVCEHKDGMINFIEKNKEYFTEEQRRELLMKAFGL